MIIVSFYAERRDQFPDAPDYRPLLDLLARSAARFGHRHVCITDAATAPTLPCETFVTDLPHNLMQAVIVGQLAWLRSAEFTEDAVLVGADCLIARDPAGAFGDGDADVIVTSRPWDDAPINNGAVYVRHDVRRAVVALYERAMEACGEEWGADQNAVAAAVAPVPAEHGIATRHGLRILFAPMRTHNAAPKSVEDVAAEAFVVHFKGPRKAFMPVWAARHLGIGDAKPAAVPPAQNWRLYNPMQSKIMDHIYASAARGLPMVREGRHQGRTALIVGTGPSLDAPEVRARIREVAKGGAVVIAIKSATRILREMSVPVRYSINCDAQANQVAKTPIVPGVTYLLASCCHPDLFEHVLGGGCRVELFHSVTGAKCDKTGVSEVEAYHTCFPDHWIAQGGMTVANRAIAVAYHMGCAHVVLVGCDFGIRASGEEAVDRSAYYAAGATGGLIQGANFVNDGGAIDGRPWHTQPSLIVSAVSVGRLVRAGYVSVVGDSLAAAFAANPEMMDRAVRKVA